MKFYNWLIRFRLPLSLVLLGLGVWVHISAGFWPSFVLYLIFLVLFVSHFVFGPLRLIQTYIEQGNMDKAQKLLDGIRYPALLYKPIRSVYFTVKGSLAMMNKDFDAAEAHMKKSLDLGLPMKEAEGANKLQLGMLALQKGDLKTGESLLKQALKDGVPDNETRAMGLLQLSSLFANKREFRQAKDYFRRAKALKPKNTEIKAQIKQMDRYMSQLPG